MRKINLEALAVFIASAITFILIYLRTPIAIYQQTIAVLLIFLVIFYTRYFSRTNSDRPLKPPTLKFSNRLLIFASSFIVQLLIISSGGLLSPFLIIFHIYILGLNFFSIPSSLTFVVLTLGDLFFFLWLNTTQLNLVRADPGTTLLYLSSLLAIVPLSMFVTSKYQLKVQLVTVLSKSLKLSNSILDSLEELIIVTDRDLNIISVNGTAARVLLVSQSEIAKSPLFDTLFLKKQSDNQIIDSRSLAIDKIRAINDSSLIKDLLLFTRNSSFPRKVDLLIKPTFGLEGKIDRLTFLIIPSKKTENQAGQKLNLEEVRTKHIAMIEDLKTKLTRSGSADVRIMAELIEHASLDLTNIYEIENGLIKISPSLVDVAQICQKGLLVFSDFANLLKVNLEFRLTNFTNNYPENIPPTPSISWDQVTSPYFTGPVDVKWFDYLLSKLIVIAILLSSETSPTRQVVLTVEKNQADTSLIVKVKVNYPPLDPEAQRDIFLPYYGKLGLSTNLKLGSGLEGYLAHSVAGLMNVPLTLEQEAPPFGLCFKVVIGPVPAYPSTNREKTE